MLDTLLNQRFRLEAEVGQGGMGKVYRAHDEVLNRKVAVKMLNASGLGTEGRARLLREARAAAQLNHPNIVGMYDAGEADGQPFIVMELVEGESLYTRWPFALEQVLSIGEQISAALEHAHAHNVIHRDLKLENVLLTPEGVVKLTDFGLARSAASRFTSEGAFVGTVFYLAPELALGQPYDGRADLYALGVLLYELVTGKLPFTGDDPLAVVSQHLYAPVVPPRAHAENLPPALDALIVRLLSKHPEGRPESARAVREALAQLHASAGSAPSEAAQPASAAPSPTVNILDRIVRGRLVGREREWGEVSTHWQRAVEGDAHILLISGEPGIGKTRLARELTTLAEVSRAVALTGECYSEGGSPYAPVAEMLYRAPIEVLRSLPPVVLADLTRLAPLLHLRLPETSPNPALDPATEQQRLFESFVALITALTAAAPVLMVIDDAHWGDSGTLFLVRHLARRARAAKLRLLIVLTYREVELDSACCLEDVLHDFNRERLATRLKLTRLSRAQTDLLVRTLLDADAPADFLADLHRETEGNPFFIEEVCKTLIEDGQLHYHDGLWHRHGHDKLEIPQSIRITIQARLNKLPSSAQDALRMAAILGREFEFQVLLQATEQNEETLIEALETAQRAQLIEELRGRAPAETFAFAHALIPATLRDGVSGPRRQRLHRRAALALEHWRPDDLEALALHWAGAGDSERAVHAYRRAGQRAQAVYANQEALRFYGEALAYLPDGHPDRFELLTERAKIYDLIADRPAQRAEVEALAALAQRLNNPRQQCEALLARADWELGAQMFEAKGAAQEAAAVARALGDPHLEARALWRLGWGHHFQGEVQTAKELLQAAIQQFRVAGDIREAAACLNRLALVLVSGLGEWALAQQAAEEAVALSRQAGDRQQEAISLRRLAIVYGAQKRFAEQEALIEQILPVARALGNRNEESLALYNLGVVLAYLHRLDESETYLRQAKDLAAQIGLELTVNNAVSALIRIHLVRRGDYEAALRLVADEMALAEAARADTLWHLLLGQRVTLLIDLGQYEQAREHMTTYLAYVRAHLGATFFSSVQTQSAYLSALQHRWTEARQLANEALASVQTGGSRADMAARQSIVALVTAMEGEATSDLATLRAGYEQGREPVAALRAIEPEETWGPVLAVLAHFAVLVDTPPAALAISTEAVELVENNLFFLTTPERLWFDHAAALKNMGHVEAAQKFGQRAYVRVMEISQRLADEALRAGWLAAYINRDIVRVWGNNG